MSKFIVIFGPPAVGKMTIGEELAKQCGFKMLINHNTIDLLLKFFEWGTDSFERLNSLFRDEIIKEFSQSDISGLIFTYVWDLNSSDDLKTIKHYLSFFKKENEEVYFVELESTLKVRLERNITEKRLLAKSPKRDLEHSRANLLETEEYKVNSTEDFYFKNKNYIKIENSNLSEVQVADKIKEHFKF